MLITGAGGMFGGVLQASGIGAALTSSLSGLGVPPLLQAFLIATALRVAQGSATVALTTASGLVAAQAEGLGDLQIALVVSRSRPAPRCSRTWTVMKTTLGLSAFGLAALLWPVASALA